MSNNKQKITKAVIPAAGFGTRFLPATKAMPKEMMPLVDKPIIQYVVEEAVSAGIEDIVIITGWHKRGIEDHFDYPFELEKRLEQSGKEKELEEIRRIADMANFYYVRQKGVPGTASAILNARKVIGNEPFLVLWGDDFIESEPSRSLQLLKAYEKNGGSAILGGLRLSGDEDYKRYGYVTGEKTENGVLKVDKMIEKPGPGMIDSDLAVLSGFVFGPEMFDALQEAIARKERNNTLGEVIYADGVNILLEQSKDVYALEIEGGKYHDCGNKIEYIKSVIEFALKHEELNGELRAYLKNLEL